VRVLLSVADRSGLVDLVHALRERGAEILADEPTRAALAEDGLQVTQAPRPLPALHEAGVDLLIANLPALPAGPGVLPVDELAGRIDPERVALIVAAARDLPGVAVVTEPRRYRELLDELARHDTVSSELRVRLAAEALAHVAERTAEAAAVLQRLAGGRFPERLPIVLHRERALAYGQNPHQEAALYRVGERQAGTLVGATLLQGGAPTFNDLLDLDAAWRIARDFGGPTCAIVKQQDPVGLATNETAVVAYRRAVEGDPVGAIGAVLALNRIVDAETAGEVALGSYEALLAPGFAPEARAILAERPQLALLALGEPAGPAAEHPAAELELRRIDGGILVETRDRLEMEHDALRVVTQRRPTLEELTDLLFAWRAVRHARSTAVVLARHAALVGVGAGQASRLAATELALHRAGERADHAALAADAYFPFADAIVLAAERGVTAIIQPGGSVRDEMAVEVADRHHLAMVFTGRRHYRR